MVLITCIFDVLCKKDAEITLKYANWTGLDVRCLKQEIYSFAFYHNGYDNETNLRYNATILVS